MIEINCPFMPEIHLYPSHLPYDNPGSLPLVVHACSYSIQSIDPENVSDDRAHILPPLDHPSPFRIHRMA